MLLLLFTSMGWDYVFEVRLSTGPLFISQVIYMSMEPWGNDIDKEKLKSLSQCDFIHHKSHIDTWRERRSWQCKAGH
jgi:hypothetical protein